MPFISLVILNKNPGPNHQLIKLPPPTGALSQDVLEIAQNDPKMWH